MTRVYFVRHGKRDSTPGDPGLTAAGRAEAVATGHWLCDRRITRLYASPLRRATETAHLIANHCGLEVRVDSRLRERANWGDLPGQTFDEFAAMWERCNGERDYAPPVGDSSRGAGKRIEDFVAAVHRELPDASVVAVCHGGILADFLRNVAATADLARIHPEFASDPYSGAAMPECAVSIVCFDGRHHRVEAIASASHLDRFDV